jgi:hypothetical protein
MPYEATSSAAHRVAAACVAAHHASTALQHRINLPPSAPAEPQIAGMRNGVNPSIRSPHPTGVRTIMEFQTWTIIGDACSAWPYDWTRAMASRTSASRVSTARPINIAAPIGCPSSANGQKSTVHSTPPAKSHPVTRSRLVLPRNSTR